MWRMDARYAPNALDSLDHAIRACLRTRGGIGEARPRCQGRRGSVSSAKMLRFFVVALSASLVAGCGSGDCANVCDLCPADSDPSPVDSDGDGLPDACDPDPTTAASANKLLYFEPFDAVNAKWSGDNATTVMMSFLNLDPGAPGIVLSNNA